MTKTIIKPGQIWRRKSDGTERRVEDCAYGDNAYGYARLRKVEGGTIYSTSAAGLRRNYELVSEPTP